MTMKNVCVALAIQFNKLGSKHTSNDIGVIIGRRGNIDVSGGHVVRRDGIENIIVWNNVENNWHPAITGRTSLSTDTLENSLALIVYQYFVNDRAVMLQFVSSTPVLCVRQIQVATTTDGMPDYHATHGPVWHGNIELAVPITVGGVLKNGMEDEVGRDLLLHEIRLYNRLMSSGEMISIYAEMLNNWAPM